MYLATPQQGNGIRAIQFRTVWRVTQVKRLALQPVLPCLPGPVMPHQGQRRLSLGAHLADDVQRLVGLRRAYCGNPWLDDAGLFPGNFGQAIPQPIDMVVAQGSDDGHLGRDDVGRVQPAPQPHFDHGGVQTSTVKVKQGQRRDGLKGRQFGFSVKNRAALLGQCYHGVTGDQFPVRLDALAKSVQVG